MPETVHQRKIEMLRRYLNALRDDKSDRSGRNGTLQRVARDQDIPIHQLRSFRDGRDSALNKSLVSTWAKLLGSGADADESSGEDAFASLFPEAATNRTRIQRMELYEQIDQCRPEAAAAFDAWSDIVCTGSIGEDRYKGGFEPSYQGKDEQAKKALSDIAKNVNTFLLPMDQLLMEARDMAKYGEQFEQIGIEFTDGKPDVTRLQNMPVKTMWRHKQKDGSVDPKASWKQVLDGKNEINATFPEWKIIHFANRVSRAEEYGRSILFSNLRSYIQVEAMEASMIVRRLERAPLRMKHTVDVGHVSSEAEMSKALSDYKNRHKKRPTVDGNRNYSTQRINMPPEEDYYLAKRDKESPSNIEALQGDANLDEVADFLHFFNKWLSGLGPPKAHLGYESDTQRSVVSDLHMVFARKGRRMQMKLISGLVHLYWVSLILRNIDPRSVPFSIFPPALGTRDELLRAQVQMTHATTVRYLAQSFSQTGEQPSVAWFLRYVMGMEDEVVSGLELVPVVSGGSSGNLMGKDPPKPPSNTNAVERDLEMAAAALGDEEIVKMRRHLDWMINERALSMRKPELMIRPLPENLVWMNPIHPFSGETFRSVVQGLRVKDLKVL